MAGQPNASYIITRDGRMVSRDEGVPSLVDIAVSLSRMPRFAGNTSMEWSVLDHSLFMERLAQRYATAMLYDPPKTRALRLAALLHDAHEAITGDIPTAFKSPEMKEIQFMLDTRIMREYFPGGYVTYAAMKDPVAALDRHALLAEGMVVGPFSYSDEDAMLLHFGEKPDAGAVRQLKQMLMNGPVGPPADPSLQGAARENVQAFLGKYAELR